MKRVFIALACFAFSWVAYSQQMPGNDPEQVVRRILDTGLYEGHDNKVIGSLGDAAAVVVTKVASARTLTDSQIEAVLLVLRSAFSDIHSISNVADREPRTALFVLKSLHSSTDNPALWGKIDATSTFIQKQYAKTIPASSPK